MAGAKKTEVQAKETKVPKGVTTKASSDNFKAIPTAKQTITKERIKELLPRGSSANISDEVLEMIENLEKDTGLPQDLMEEEVYGYMHVLSKVGKTKLTDFINAVKYCNLKRNYSNEKAWSIVFPDRYQRLKENGGQIDAHVAMYNKSQVVKEIDKEMLIPFYLQYQSYAHASIKKLYDLTHGRAAPNSQGEAMTVTPMVQMLAAKSLLEATQMPEEAKIDITVSKGDEELEVQRQMNEQLAQLVSQQKARLNAGESIESVQKIGVKVSEAIEAELAED